MKSSSIDIHPSGSGFPTLGITTSVVVPFVPPPLPLGGRYEN
eukprot:CAMPEP_0183776196 /NCGR_PEP_ID=MMETSP0739-20130205/46252_1 /TAXON_ID=385413 /ORGANISM="Thalassiosira miniscula, Strain CCMP1093" /LENGTH=41 /DNA_ID= /DNA_START= /DNA_END= /DNA_ORIENTATION=